MHNYSLDYTSLLEIKLKKTAALYFKEKETRNKDKSQPDFDS